MYSLQHKKRRIIIISSSEDEYENFQGQLRPWPLLIRSNELAYLMCIACLRTQICNCQLLWRDSFCHLVALSAYAVCLSNWVRSITFPRPDSHLTMNVRIGPWI